MDDKDKIRLKYEDKHYIYLITELCTGGDLFDEILKRKQLDQKDAAKVIKQVLSAISYCHDNKVAHRDLKPENILLNSKNNADIVKVIDFGTS